MENLVKLGFTEKEARVYLMLFRMGPSPVSSLSKRLGMKRVTVYSVLEALISRGIITYEQGNAGRRYIPHDPSCLLEELEQEKAGLKTKIEIAKECIETLSRSSNLGLLKPNVAFYEGKGGVLKGFLDFLDPFATFRGLLLLEQMPEFLFDFLKSLESENMDVFLALSQEVSVYQKSFRRFHLKVFSSEKVNHHAFFVQGANVFFLHMDLPIKLVIITDKAYATYITDVLMAPFLS